MVNVLITHLGTACLNHTYSPNFNSVILAEKKIFDLAHRGQKDGYQRGRVEVTMKTVRGVKYMVTD